MSAENTLIATRLDQVLGHDASDKRLAVLAQIGQTGSISQAARHVGVSYKAAWQAVDTLTNLAQVPLVQRTVGGAQGGGARLTNAALELLHAAKTLELARQAALHGLRQRGGASLAAQNLAIRTSIRNQLVGRIERLDWSDRTAQVDVALPGAGQLRASITQESVEILGLCADLAVLLMCKATAVSVQRADRANVDLANGLHGRVSRVLRGQQGDEV